MSERFRYFVILAGMRTGSNLLERFLNQFSGLICHGELFNPGFIGKEGKTSYLGINCSLREANPGQLISEMIAGSSEQLPGFRLFDGHDERVERQILADPTCAKIILRRNPIESLKGIAKTHPVHRCR